MTIEDNVRSASSPQEALLALARGLDEVLAQTPEAVDPWGGLGAWKEPPPVADSVPPVTTEEDEKGNVTVTIAPADDERKAARLLLAGRLGLDDQFGAADPPWDEVYAKGGPIWLYNVDRDFVMSLPAGLKALMVQDVELDDPTTAQEMGRDLLKDTSPAIPDLGAPGT